MSKQRQYILVGYPFAGKTTLAKGIEKRLGFRRLNIDDVKFEMGFEDRSDDDVPDKDWARIFNELDKRIVESLKEGKTIVNEYAWLTRDWRDRARKLADDLEVETKLIFVNTPQDVVRERWLQNRKTNKRFDIPDSVFEDSLRLFEKPTSDENVLVYSESDNLDEWIKENIL